MAAVTLLFYVVGDGKSEDARELDARADRWRCAGAGACCRDSCALRQGLGHTKHNKNHSCHLNFPLSHLIFLAYLPVRRFGN